MPAVTYIDESIYHAIAEDAEIASLVGQRIAHVQQKQGTAMPYIVITRSSQSRDEYAHLLGAGDMARASYMVSAVDPSLETVRTITKCLRRVLDSRSEHPIRLCVVRDENEQQEEAASGDQLPVNRTDLMLDVIYTTE